MSDGSARGGRAPGEIADAGVFALLTLIWGTTWAAIRVALDGIPPLTGVAVRFALAGAVLLVLVRARGIALGRTRIERRLWWVNAATTFAGSYSLVYWAEQWVPSGLAAVLFATFPIWVVLLGRILLPAERVSSARVAAVLLGFAGVAVIFSEDFSRLGGADVRRASLVMLAAPLLSALGSVCLRRWGSGISPLSLAAVPMLLTGGALGLVAAATERGQPLLWTPAPWLATLYLSLFGSALTFTLYFWLLARRSALFSSLISYTVPVIAVLIGWLFLDEPVTGRVLAGGGLVLLGVGLGGAAAPRAPEGSRGRLTPLLGLCRIAVYLCRSAENTRSVRGRRRPPPGAGKELAMSQTTHLHVSEREARRVAEASRETEWKQPGFLRELFLGRFRLDLLHPFPLEAEERPEFAAFYRALQEFLCERVDPGRIDEAGEYPPEVVDGLRKLGAFGMKIPDEYGGLGLHRHASTTG